MIELKKGFQIDFSMKIEKEKIAKYFDQGDIVRII